MGVETNAMQFYPDASLAEEAVHPGLFRRRDGQLDLSSINGPGFGYRLSEIQRQLDELESGQGPRMRIVTNDGSGAREMPRDQVNQMMRERIQNRGFYPEIAVTRRLAAGWGGLLWLERSRVNPDEPGPIDLFTAAGEYRGTIADDGARIPDAFGPDGLVAYIERDEMDVPRVVVRRLPAAVR